jgi:hypothetical protein
MFAMTIIADQGMIAVGAETDWIVEVSIGDTELRKASPGADGHHWSYVLEHHEVVHTSTELRRFLCSGGHALVNQTLDRDRQPSTFQKGSLAVHSVNWSSPGMKIAAISAGGRPMTASISSLMSIMCYLIQGEA